MPREKLQDANGLAAISLQLRNQAAGQQAASKGFSAPCALQLHAAKAATTGRYTGCDNCLRLIMRAKFSRLVETICIYDLYSQYCRQLNSRPDSERHVAQRSPTSFEAAGTSSPLILAARTPSAMVARRPGCVT